MWLVMVPELLLSGGVENVEKAGYAVDRHLHAVGVLDGGIVVFHEVMVEELDRQRRLAHSASAHHHDLVFNRHADLRLCCVCVCFVSLPKGQLVRI